MARSSSAKNGKNSKNTYRASGSKSSKSSSSGARHNSSPSGSKKRMSRLEQRRAQQQNLIRSVVLAGFGILAIALVTMIPSIYLTLGILRSTMFERQARLFVQNEMKFNNARVLSTHADAKHNQIQVVMIGQPVDTILIRQAADRLPQYHLNETRLDVVQSGTQMDENEIRDIVNGIYDRRINGQTEAEKRINELELAVARMQQHDKLSATVFPELKTLFPRWAACPSYKDAQPTAPVTASPPTVLPT